MLAQVKKKGRDQRHCSAYTAILRRRSPPQKAHLRQNRGSPTGHSDYSSMKPYIDIVDDIKATSMTKFNGLL